MKISETFDIWAKYPCYVMEKSIETNRFRYTLIKNALQAAEGLAIGAGIYYFSGNGKHVTASCIAAFLTRHVQTIHFLYSNRDRLDKLRKKHSKD